MKKLPLAIAVSAAILSSGLTFVQADELAPLNFHGYMRGGTGLGSESGENPSVNKQQIGRLGNENDMYSEFGFGKEVYNEDGVSFLVDSMIAAGVTGNVGWESTEVNIAQFNVQAKGLFDFDKEAVLWAGKRFYQRHDIHITDFYYWDTSGSGGGIENVQLGAGKLSVAVLQNDGSQKNATTAADEAVSGYIADIRYAGIPLWTNASLELGFNYNFANEKNEQDLVADDGMMGTAILTQGFGGGFNKTVIQFGTSAYGAQMSQYGAGGWYDRSGKQDDAVGSRVINWGVASFGDKWELGHQALIGSAADVGLDKHGETTISLVVRPMYKWDDHMKTILEVGAYQTVEEGMNGKKDTEKGAGKITLAQAWSAGSSFWARPEIRVYTSYISDFENEQAFGKDTDSEMSVGIQAEAWW